MSDEWLSPGTDITPAAPDNPWLSGQWRQRHDGWTAEKMDRFLAALAETGCVRDAARTVGLSATSAYRLRAHQPDFAEAWSSALDVAQQGLMAVAYKRAVEGRETIIIRNGQEVERRIAPSDAMLSLLVKRGDLDGRREQAMAQAITWQEHQDGWHFDVEGRKVQGPSLAEQAHNTSTESEAAKKVKVKLLQLYDALHRQKAQEPICSVCGGPATDQMRAYYLSDPNAPEIPADATAGAAAGAADTGQDDPLSAQGPFQAYPWD